MTTKYQSQPPAAGQAEHTPFVTHLLYGLPAGETRRYMEDILATGSLQRVESIKPIAARDGWHSFRIAKHVEGDRPDFVGSISR